jgi:hypothetical protein
MEPAVSPHSPEETKRIAFFLRGTLRLSAESVDGHGFIVVMDLGRDGFIVAESQKRRLRGKNRKGNK